ncbi:hypothetical protein R1flu_000893 [Riccia fluitans]|uniref:Uncharacterized protein n=1 Tax=Riccia fluitans TaxID=41844 RepID=A0ABD1Y1W8_9MARC
MDMTLKASKLLIAELQAAVPKGDRWLCNAGADEVSASVVSRRRSIPLRTRHYVSSFIGVHKIVDLSASPDRESLLHLELAECHEKFYESLLRSQSAVLSVHVWDTIRAKRYLQELTVTAVLRKAKKPVR